MFDPQRIQSAFIGLAGLRQTDDPAYSQLPSDILYTGNNVLISHPLVNIENLEMTARNYRLFNFPAWAVGTTYVTGDKITSGGVVYESLQNANTGNDPATTPAFWAVVNLLGLYLYDLFLTAGSEVVQEVMERKKLRGNTKTLLQNLRLSEKVGGFNDKVINEGSLVGVEIVLKHRQNIMAVINRIGFQFTGPIASLTLYVFHSSQTDAVATAEIAYTGTGGLEWKDVNFKLNYLTASHDVGGVWYVMYDQTGLAVQAIKRRANFNSPPCGYCDKREVTNFNLYSKYLSVRTVEVLAANRNGVAMWDIEKTTYASDNNFGLNLEFTVKCDLTEFIIQQKDVFSYAYRDMVIKKMVEGMAHSTRQNVAQEKVMQMARAELQERSVGGMGLMEELEKKLKAVDFELSDLDSTCMPCNKESGLRYTSAGLNG